MATRTFTTAGINNLWSNAANWDTGVPVDTDTAVIPAGQTTDFDVDQSAFGSGITLTINGTLTAGTTAGAYYLKLQNADMTIGATGVLRGGTSVAVPYPSTCTFTIDHNNNAKSIEVASGGHIYLYCTQPTNKYVYMSSAGTAGDDHVHVNGYDLTTDGPWNIANAQIRIVNSTPLNTGINTISSVVANQINIVGSTLASNKSNGSMVCLVTRNIRIINVAASDYAITYASGAGSGDHLGCEMNNVYRGISGGTGWEFAGTSELLTTSPTFALQSKSATISGTLAGPTSGSSFVSSSCESSIFSGTFAGWTRTGSAGYANTVSGYVFGCTTAMYLESSLVITSTGNIDHCTTGLQQCMGIFFYGSLFYNANAILEGTGVTLAGTLQNNTTSDLSAVGSGRAYNTVFSGTEFNYYNGTKRAISDYFESFDHDGNVNAFKAWCKGGIVSSQTVSPPTGYTIFYDHEVESATYPCFRQYLTTVAAGTAIEVSAVIRNTDGIDVSSTSPIDLRPRLEIIDVFADPLVDSTQTALASDAIATSDGSDTDWQNVSVIWANQGDAPRQVYVRIICYSHDASTHTIDEAWSVANYQTEITETLKRVKRLGLPSEF